jgi:hypothetical protein
MKRSSGSQDGMSTLLMSVLILMLMSLYVITDSRESKVSLQIVGNMQAQRQADLAVQQGIETSINTTAFLSATTGTSLTVGNWTVDVQPPRCLMKAFQAGTDLASDLPQYNAFEVVASGRDPVTGSVSTIHQGVSMVMSSEEADAAGIVCAAEQILTPD